MVLGTNVETSNIPQTARLDGQVAVVTGGGRGIGWAAAIRLAKAGPSVVVTARTVSEIEETARQIRASGGSSTAFPADVSDWDAMVSLAGEKVKTFASADIVVVNAGVIEPIGNA